jgi:hypothetical protein
MVMRWTLSFTGWQLVFEVYLFYALALLDNYILWETCMLTCHLSDASSYADYKLLMRLPHVGCVFANPVNMI